MRAVQDWSEFTDWPAPLGSWPVPEEDVQGRQWAQQIYLAPGAPCQLVRPRTRMFVHVPLLSSSAGLVAPGLGEGISGGG